MSYCKSIEEETNFPKKFRVEVAFATEDERDTCVSKLRNLTSESGLFWVGQFINIIKN